MLKLIQEKSICQNGLNLSENNMHELIAKRRSIRKFLDKPVEEEKIRAILAAGMVAPSGMNKKEYEFVVVKDKLMLEKLSKVGRWMDFIKNCGVAIVIISKENMFWIEDSSLVNAFIILEAVNQRLGTCWVDVKDGLELDNTDREKLVRELLGIPSEYRVLNILVVGYTDQKIKQHSDEEFKSEKVHIEKFSNTL